MRWVGNFWPTAEAAAPPEGTYLWGGKGEKLVWLTTAINKLRKSELSLLVLNF